jgi:hypothetical protein
MQDFLEPIFEFMEGNFVILNIIILYGVPVLIGFCGLICNFSENKIANVIGILLILLSVVAICVLGYYAIINGIIFTGICGFVFAGSIVYSWFFNKDEIVKKADIADIKAKADYGNIESMLKMGKEYFITDKNVSAKYFEQAAKKGNAEAQYRLGRIYYEFLERKQEGIEWLKKSALQNYKQAIDKLNNIGGLLEPPDSTEKEVPVSISDFNNEIEDFAEELKEREYEKKIKRMEILKKEYSNIKPNQFSPIMITRTDEQIKATINASQGSYNPEAIEAAKQEQVRREIVKIELSEISNEKLLDFLKQKQNEIDKDYAREEAEKRNLIFDE